MIYIGIDPGSTHSGYVEMTDRTEILDKGKIENGELEEILFGYEKRGDEARLAIEEVVSYGKPVGSEVFATVFWSGRFAAAWDSETYTGGKFVRRAQAKKWLGLHNNATDADVRFALSKRFTPSGRNGKGEPCPWGTKKTPGPLYGVKTDALAALAVAMTAAVQWETLKPLPSP